MGPKPPRCVCVGPLCVRTRTAIDPPAANERGRAPKISRGPIPFRRLSTRAIQPPGGEAIYAPPSDNPSAACLAGLPNALSRTSHSRTLPRLASAQSNVERNSINGKWRQRRACAPSGTVRNLVYEDILSDLQRDRVVCQLKRSERCGPTCLLRWTRDLRRVSFRQSGLWCYRYCQNELSTRFFSENFQTALKLQSERVHEAHTQSPA